MWTHIFEVRSEKRKGPNVGFRGGNLEITHYLG